MRSRGILSRCARSTSLGSSRAAIHGTGSPENAAAGAPAKSADNAVNVKLSRQIAGINFPDLIEFWDRDMFKKTGTVLTMGTLGLNLWLGLCQETVILDVVVAAYWAIGIHDINQKSHTILANFPVLGNIRYMFEVSQLRVFLFAFLP